MNGTEPLSAALLVVGAAFFAAGTAGVLRFPDVYSRLHALTKADNLGLGFVVAGLALQAESIPAALKLVAIWVLALVGSAGACYLIARDAWRHRTDASSAARERTR